MYHVILSKAKLLLSYHLMSEWASSYDNVSCNLISCSGILKFSLPIIGMVALCFPIFLSSNLPISQIPLIFLSISDLHFPKSQLITIRRLGLVCAGNSLLTSSWTSYLLKLQGGVFTPSSDSFLIVSDTASHCPIFDFFPCSACHSIFSPSLPCIFWPLPVSAYQSPFTFSFTMLFAVRHSSWEIIPLLLRKWKVLKWLGWLPFSFKVLLSIPE